MKTAGVGLLTGPPGPAGGCVGGGVGWAAQVCVGGQNTWSNGNGMPG
jgi:hypothetical protein